MLSRRFVFFLESGIVMQGYECGKHNNNMKETLVLQSERKIQGKKIYWKLKILLGQLLLMLLHFHGISHIMHLFIVKEFKLNETNTILYPYLKIALALLLYAEEILWRLSGPKLFISFCRR